MTIITEETIEETMDATVKEAGEGNILETVEEAGAGSLSETVEDVEDGMISETIEDTVEQVKDKALPGTERGHSFRLGRYHSGQRRISGMKVQGEQWKRMAGWLAPYVAVLVLILLTGVLILLATGLKTDHLSRQIQEQYGEYFTDGK